MNPALEALRSERLYDTMGYYDRTHLQFPRPPRAKNTVVHVTGGLGDNILSIPIVEEMQQHIGEPVIVYCRYPEIFRLFSDLDARDEEGFLIEGADHWVTLNTLVLFQFQRNFKNFASPKLRELYLNYQGFISQGDWEHYVVKQPALENFTGRAAMDLGLTRRTLPGAILGLKNGHPGVRRARIKVPTTLRGASYITVHDGYDDANANIANRSMKNWSLRNWELLIAKIHKCYPNVEIVQVGSQYTSRPLPGVDVDLLGATTLPECMKVIEGAKLHIDGESGLVHAAWLMGTKSIVMFGPTPPKFFGHPENVNLAPIVCADEYGCWWTKETWMARCALGNLRPICIDSITPNQVFAEAERILG